MGSKVEPNVSTASNSESNQDLAHGSIKPVSAVSRKLQDATDKLAKLRNRQIALMKEITDGREALESAPKEAFTTSYSQNAEFDEYKEVWRKHVETCGNDNYPAQLSAQGLSGKLILDAVIQRNGSLLRVDIARPSGNPIVDQAAIEIVKSCMPYPALPAKHDPNVLVHIIRTWEFKHSKVTSSAY